MFLGGRNFRKVYRTLSKNLSCKINAYRSEIGVVRMKTKQNFNGSNVDKTKSIFSKCYITSKLLVTCSTCYISLMLHVFLASCFSYYTFHMIHLSHATCSTWYMFFMDHKLWYIIFKVNVLHVTCAEYHIFCICHVLNVRN